MNRATLHVLGVACLLGTLAAVAADREPKRPEMPEIKAPVMFDTPEADKILAALQVFPPDNPWNEDVSRLPLLPTLTVVLGLLPCRLRPWPQVASTLAVTAPVPV